MLSYFINAKYFLKHFYNYFSKPLLLLLLLSILLTSSGCNIMLNTSHRTDLNFKKDTMFHMKQVLEHYDAEDNSVPQYLEFWLTEDKGKCIEYDAEGNVLNVILDTGKQHIQYDPATLSAIEASSTLLFIMNYSEMSKLYTRELYNEKGNYADRPCNFYLLENKSGVLWLKMYVDTETGYTLFSENERLRLRTALFEEIPVDENLFTAPTGLDFKEGD